MLPPTDNANISRAWFGWLLIFIIIGGAGAPPCLVHPITITITIINHPRRPYPIIIYLYRCHFGSSPAMTAGENLETTG